MTEKTEAPTDNLAEALEDIAEFIESDNFHENLVKILKKKVKATGNMSSRVDYNIQIVYHKNKGFSARLSVVQPPVFNVLLNKINMPHESY